MVPARRTLAQHVGSRHRGVRVVRQPARALPAVVVVDLLVDVALRLGLGRCRGWRRGWSVPAWLGLVAPCHLRHWLVIVGGLVNWLCDGLVRLHGRWGRVRRGCCLDRVRRQGHHVRRRNISLSIVVRHFYILNAVVLPKRRGHGAANGASGCQAAELQALRRLLRVHRGAR